MVRTLALLSLASFCAVLSHERDRSWGPPQELCTIDDAEVGESSGIAASGTDSGVFFTHNDSGDTARFFRFDRKGHVDGTYTLEGVEATDWEDMAQATVGGQSYLYFADVGDNGEEREHVMIHRVPEPKAAGDVALKEFQTYRVKYPDSPHNCEAVFVRSNGDVWVVTKSPGGNSKVFVLRSPKAPGDYKFAFVADIAVDTSGFGGKYVTGADLAPDEAHVVLRTYSAGLEFAVPSKFEDWTKSKPLVVRFPLETQGEAVCYSKDGTHLLTTSEFAPCPVSIMALQGS